MTHPLRMRICLPVVAAAFATALVLPCAASAQDAVPGQVIVRYEPGSSAADRADARSDSGTKAVEGLGMARAQLLDITDGDSVAQTIHQLEGDDAVAYAEPNSIFQPASVPDDPGFQQQWGLLNSGQLVNGVSGTPDADIDADGAWDIPVTGSDVVAVMDTGADLSGTDLQNQLWTNPETNDAANGYIGDVHGYDFYSDDPNPTDLSGHGTHVSGIVAAQADNNWGTAGVSSHASLMELRVCGTYTVGCPVADMITAMNYAGDNGARILNGSLVGGTFNQSMRDAAESHPDTLYVFAAGNGDSNGNPINVDSSPAYPCAIDQPVSGVAPYTQDNVICVAATNQFDARAGFSNFGARSVDLGAPGVNILSTSAEKTLLVDDFEGADFATRWTNDPGNTSDWQASSEAPLNSVGITDSPGTSYAPNTDSTVTSNPVALPADLYSTCELDYYRSVQLGSGDHFTISVLLDKGSNGSIDTTVTRTFNGPLSSAATTFFPLNPQFDGGGAVQVQLHLTSDGSGQATGVHMDNIKLVCHGSPSDSGTEFLSGTSMATPMVAGAASLLFAQAPSSTPAQVKAALLNSVDPEPDLAATTVSGGRLNLLRALEGSFNPTGGAGAGSSSGQSSGTATTPTPSVTVRPDTFFKRKPGRVVRTSAARARIVFKFGSDAAGSSFRCELDSVEYTPCPKRYVRRLVPGRHVLKVRAVSGAGLEDSSAAVAKFRVKRSGG
jgi:subtilisin family serine protease